MQTLRNATLIARFVLVWFALFVGASVASPIVKPGDVHMVCSGSGGMKIVVSADDDGTVVKVFDTFKVNKLKFANIVGCTGQLFDRRRMMSMHTTMAVDPNTRRRSLRLPTNLSRSRPSQGNEPVICVTALTSRTRAANGRS